MPENTIGNLTEKVTPFNDDLIEIEDSETNPVSSKKVKIGNLSSVISLPTTRNILINSGFDLFQRQAPNTLTERADDNYSADRWYVLTQTGSIQTQRTSGDTLSQNSIRLKQIQASSQRFGIAQIVECINSIANRGQTLYLNTRVKISNSQVVRIALLEWTGTEDTVTSDIVKDWTSSTYTPDNFFITNNLNVVGTATITPESNTWTDLCVSGDISANCNNLIVMIWTEGTAAQNFTLDITEADLFRGTDARTWEPRAFGDEVALCQRYYEKSYALDTAPASSTVVGLILLHVYNNSIENNVRMGHVAFCVEKLVAPTVTTYGYNGGTSKISNSVTGADLASSSGVPIYIGPNGFGIQNQSGDAAVTSQNSVIFHYVAESEL